MGGSISARTCLSLERALKRRKLSLLRLGFDFSSNALGALFGRFRGRFGSLINVATVSKLSGRHVGCIITRRITFGCVGFAVVIENLLHL
jgi:hypothetical protein